MGDASQPVWAHRTRELEATFSSALGRPPESNMQSTLCAENSKRRTEKAILLIDATNAFNLLNRTTALENISRMCPSLHIPLSNSYQTPSRLFVDKKAIISRVGCTQGDPLAMLMYGIAIKPLILKLQTPKIVQKW